MDNEVTTPLYKILDQVKEIVEESELLAVLNSSAPLDNDNSFAENPIKGLMPINNNSPPGKNWSSNGDQESNSNNEKDLQTLASLTQVTAQAMNVTSDSALLEGLQLVEQLVCEIQERNLLE